MPVLILLLAAAAAVLSYRLLEGWGPKSWVPALCRAGGWGAISLLIVNASCPARAGSEPALVLLDGSLSMIAGGGKGEEGRGRWTEALALARSLGEVRIVGALPGDTLPTGGRSRLATAIAGARASNRRVIVVTDGEIEDADAIPPEALAGVEVRVLERKLSADLAITRLEGTTRITPADSLRLDLEVESFGTPGAKTVQVTAREGDRVWLRGAVVLDPAGRGRAVLQGPVPQVPAGAHTLTVALVGAADAEPRNDARLLVVTVVPTPGVVLLASPPTWESRFLLETLRDVSALPVRGYLETERGRWRRAGDLRPVPTAEVLDAARRADLLITLGTVGQVPSRARSRWVWPPTVPAPGAIGDWYLSVPPATPVSGAFAGLAVDSFPPGTALSVLTPGPRAWTGLTAQLTRRGAVRPVMTGQDTAGVRRVVTAIDGLWRWAFRGGSSEQGYRALVASTVSWLLGGADSAAGRARLSRNVVQQGRPAIFEAVGAPDSGRVIPIELSGPSGVRRDTLIFDGAGRAELLAPPGVWRYKLAGGGEGTLAVEEYSDEWLPAPRTLAAREASVAPAGERISLRTYVWLFALAVMAFAGEWFARRRLGLR
ncbi:MAG: hypothetical protein HOP28_06010 [Gemmatimonadales bacterium]|nr:hypothetical protein [Gemmatimonadales bacterium]